MLGKVGNDLPLRSVPATPSTPCLSSSGATELHFVVSIGKEKPNPALRKLIRSHVMLGKNRGKTLPPRKKTHKESTDSSSSNLDHSLSSISQSKPSISTNNSYYPAKIPQIFGVNMSTVQFPGDVEPKVVEVVLRCELLPDMYKCYSLNKIQFPLLLKKFSLPWSHAYFLRGDLSSGSPLWHLMPPLCMS
jgi:hypothetical protein